MATVIGSLTVDLTSDTARMRTDMQRARSSYRRDIGEIRRSTDRAAGSMERMERRAQRVRQALAGLAGAVAVRQMVSVGRAAAESANALADQADTLGLTAEQLQSYRFAALQVGITQQDLDNNMQRFVRRLGLARTGTGALSAVAEELELDLSDADRAFRQIVEAIEETDDAADAARLADAAFGRFGIAMARMFGDGVAGFEELANRLREFGGLMDNELVASAQTANTNIGAVEFAMKNAFEAGLLEVAIDSFGDLETAMAELVPLARDVGSAVGVALQGIADVTGFAARNMDLLATAGGAFAGARLGARFGGMGAAIGGLIGGLAGLITVTGDSASALERFAAAADRVELSGQEIAGTMARAAESTGVYRDALLGVVTAAREAELAVVRGLIAELSVLQARVRDLRSLDLQSGLIFPSTPTAAAELQHLQELTAELRQIANSTNTVETVEMIGRAIGHVGEFAVGSTQFLMEFGDGLRDVAADATYAASALIPFIEILPFNNPRFFRFRPADDPFVGSGASLQDVGSLTLEVPSGGGGGGAAAQITEQERVQEAVEETTLRLDRQADALRRIIAAHGQGAAAVQRAERHNRAYARAVSLGAEEDREAVAAIESRLAVIERLNTEVERAGLLQAQENERLAVQDRFELIGLSGSALQAAEARLLVVQDLRERGINLEGDLARQMIATAEATAIAQSNAEFLATAVGAAYSGLGTLATTAITNFEDLGNVAAQVLTRIANMFFEFGLQQIFGSIFGGFSLGGLFGSTKPGLKIGKVFHSGKTPGQRSGGQRRGPLMGDEFFAVLQEREEVITERDPRHRANLGRAVALSPERRGPLVDQTINISTGVVGQVRLELQRMLPKLRQETLAAVKEGTRRDPDLVEV